MTRSEAYEEGFQEGRRWAEEDIANHAGEWFGVRSTHPRSPELRAWDLGKERGYRDTWARFEAGTLTREMFEMASRGGTR